MARFPLSKQLVGLGGWLCLVAITAAIGAVASTQAGSFYRELIRPSWAPPAWVFGPVWSVLYFLMACAAWFVWREGGFAKNRRALGWFLAQLGANALWSWLFFAWHRGALAFVEILLLWGMIAMTWLAFRRVRPLAGWLLVPYRAWVTFAAALCFAIWRLNPFVL
jgi:tryptophan-rich sensory protein